MMRLNKAIKVNELEPQQCIMRGRKGDSLLQALGTAQQVTVRAMCSSASEQLGLGRMDVSRAKPATSRLVLLRHSSVMPQRKVVLDSGCQNDDGEMQELCVVS